MKLGVLEAGKVHPSLVPAYGQYAPMFERLLALADPAIEHHVYAVVDGALPDDPKACDGWLITGSKHGVYEDLPWIVPLKAFIRKAYDAKVPLIGVCFGHQIMAEALGGRAVKSPKGWGAGVHAYRVRSDPAWFGQVPEDIIALHASHQDQVVDLPPSARVIASSDFREYAALAYGAVDQPRAISIQPHPEFDEKFIRALIELRSGDGIPEQVAANALGGLGAPVHAAEMAAWMVAFLKGAKTAERAAE